MSLFSSMEADKIGWQHGDRAKALNSSLATIKVE